MRGTEFVRFSARGVAFDTVVSTEGESFMRYFQTNDFLLLRSYNFLHNARSSFGAIAPRTSFRCLARENVQRIRAGVLRFVKHRPTPFRPTTENVPRLFSGSSPFSIKTPLVFLRRRHTASRPFTTCGQRARVHTHASSFSIFAFTPSPVGRSLLILSA